MIDLFSSPNKNRLGLEAAFYILIYLFSIYLSHPETNSNNAINNNGLANYGLFGA